MHSAETADDYNPDDDAKLPPKSDAEKQEIMAALDANDIFEGSAICHASRLA